MKLGEAQAFASPEAALEHFGVKGMKWGVRKERAANLQPLISPDKPIERTTKNGDKFTLTQNPPNKLNKALAAVSKSYATKFGNSAYLDIKDSSGKTVGTANFWHKEDQPDTVYLNWITVDKSARGKGYASAVLKAAEDHSRAAGKKRMVLEVPGNAPDARHIYEKMGFVVTHEATKKERSDPVWGGLTHMEKKLDD